MACDQDAGAARPASGKRPMIPAGTLSRFRADVLGTMGRANLLEAYAGLMAARQRTGLALIGIVIGIASVSSMISIGTIVRAEAVREFEQLGTDIVNIRLRAADRQAERVAVRLPDAEAVAGLPAIAAAAPYTLGSAPAVLAGTASSVARVVGVTPAMAELGRLELAEGRFVSPLDRGSYFCTVGAETARELREASGGSVIGESIRIGDSVFRVVGALHEVPLGQRPFDANNAVLVPISTSARIVPDATLRDILARTSPGTHYREAQRQVVAYFQTRLPGARTQVRTAEELIEHMHRQLRLYTLLLGAVGGISLLVGGIGVMNVMLVAVAERRSEIGIRRALGARRRDIQAQFLTEATMLSLVGGVAGILLAMAATWAICQSVGWTFMVSAGGAVLGTLVAGGAGVIFGFLPAHQAARLDPVAALQG